MMEEVSDDTNGESTFEFVGDKSDETTTPLPQVPGELLAPLPPPPPPPPSQPSTVMTTAITNPLTSTLPHPPISTLPHPPISTLPPPAEPYISPLGQHSYSSIPSTTSLPPSISLPQPVPMFSTTTGLQSSYLSSPISSSFSPATVGSSSASHTFYQQSPTSSVSGSIPIQTPPQSSYIPAATGPPLSATLDLPLEESYGARNLQLLQQGAGSGGVWGWIKGNDFLNKVAEKAKNSVDTMITTLDPGMKEFIYSGGDIDIVVASDKEVKVSPIREAFQQVFGRATVQGLAAQAVNIAAQPVGFSAGVKAAEERINYLRQHGMVHEHQTVIAVENFLAELTPEKWFDLGCLLLHDPKLGHHLQLYSQATPVPTHFVLQAQDQTPPDYPLRWSGLAVTVGQLIGPAMGVSHKEWHQALTGVDRKEMLLIAARSLAGIYKAHLRR